MTIEKQIQLDIMNMVFNIEDLHFLSKIKSEIQAFATEKTTVNPDFMEAVEPIRDHIPLEEIIEKQNYKPIPFETYMEQVESFDWGDITLEKLLAELD